MFVSFFGFAAEFIDSFARAGGGGSSSGGGGGGGIVGAISYLPMHYLGRCLRRKMIVGNQWTAGQVIGWVICAVFAGLLLFLGEFGAFLAVCAPIGMGAGLYGWFSKLKPNRKVMTALHGAALRDRTWNETAILARAREVFATYQRDWSARDWQAMARYMTPEYHQHATLLVAALLQSGRINQVNAPQISEIIVTDMHDSAVDAEDTVTVGLSAKAQDMLIDERTNEVIFKDLNAFTEYWSFKRVGNEWYLNGIQQATEAPWKGERAMREFAGRNGFFYSLDMGWLLIPKRGRLFGRAKFGTSDINNHVIGTYNNTYLLQLYTYDPLPGTGGSYLVAQTNVPKTYGNIVVRRRDWKNFFPPRGLTKVSTEWSDFNKKYDVFASSSEGATSFELLHPAYMEKLEALPFEVNIEVVDNVVYLYARLKTEKNPPEYYQILLDILQEAYRQMRM